MLFLLSLVAAVVAVPSSEERSERSVEIGLKHTRREETQGDDDGGGASEEAVVAVVANDDATTEGRGVEGTVLVATDGNAILVAAVGASVSSTIDGASPFAFPCAVRSATEEEAEGSEFRFVFAVVFSAS